MPNSYLPQLGGLEFAVANLGCQLAKEGHEVIVVTTSMSLRFRKEIEPYGVAVYRMPLILPRIITRRGYKGAIRSIFRSLLSPFSLSISFFRLLKIVNSMKPDIVNLHYIGENAFFCLAAKRILNFTLIVDIHGNDVEWHFKRWLLPRWLTRKTLQAADRVLSNSSATLAKAELICPEIKNKSAVVGNGVYLEEFSSPERFSYPEKYILSIANFAFKKGLDVLIQAFNIVHQADPKIHLIIAGSGPEFQKCTALAEKLDLAESIKFLGRVEHSQVAPLLRGCEVFVLPSRREPFGIAILEALATKRPVVATRVDGVPEIITHKGNGLLVEPESAEELAQAILLLLYDSELGKNLAGEGYRMVRERFTWERVTEKFLAEYSSVING